MIWLKQIFLLVSCILVSLQGEVLDSDVDTQLTSSILKFLEERNYGSYRAATILQKTVMDDKLEVTFQVKRTCDYQCVEDTLKCESIFIKSEGEPLWRLAGAICLPIEPEYVQQKNIIPAYVGKPVTDQEKMVDEPKMVPLTVEEPKIVRDFVEEPKIERDFVEEPKVVHDFVQEPKVVNDFVGDPKIVRDFVEEPKIEEPKVVDEFVGDPKIVRDFIEEPKVVPHTVDVVTPKNNAEEPHLKHIEISDESPKKTVPCLGCPMDINPNAYGVTDLINTALRHIESERIQKHTALKVLRVQQQVVSGIKYTLLVEVAPTLCPKTIDAPSCPIDQSQDSFICEVQFWEKSWERFTQVIKNNCTNTQEYVYNTGFYTTTKIPEREVDFGDLESQILFDYEIEQPRTNFHEPDWVNANHQIYTPIGYGPEVILQKRRVRDIPEENEDEHHVFKRYSRDSDSDSSSSSSSESDERLVK